MIRFGRSPQRVIKKTDNLELLNLIDGCTQIFKDDRLQLRNMIKDGNPQLMALLSQHKKVSKELQTDLRKLLKKKGYEKENSKYHSPGKKITLESASAKKSCPDLWKCDVPAPKIDLHRDMVISQEIILTDRNTNQNLEIIHSKYESPLPSNREKVLTSDESVQRPQTYYLQIANQEQQVSEDSESVISEQQDYQIHHVQSENDTPINACHRVVEPQTPEKEEKEQKLPTQTLGDRSYSFFNYTDYQLMAELQYKDKFTDWKSLLRKLDQHEYIVVQKQPILLEDSAENIFTKLFPTSGNVRVNYFRFKETLMLPNVDELFRQFDQDFDDWIDYRETGLMLQSICKKVESPRNCVRVIFDTINKAMPNTLSLYELSMFIRQFGDDFSQQLFQEIDILNKGFVTYWDMYMHKDIYLMHRLCAIVQSL